LLLAVFPPTHGGEVLYPQTLSEESPVSSLRKLRRDRTLRTRRRPPSRGGDEVTVERLYREGESSASSPRTEGIGRSCCRPRRASYRGAVRVV
jgi:hypothetical protein